MNKTELVSFDFWVGTEAELIKVFPIIIELERRNHVTRIIATGQNPVWDSPLLKLFKSTFISNKLSSGPNKKTSISLLYWFIKTTVLAALSLRRGKNRILIIHGDTISTMMGAVVGWLKGYKIAHVEAGLRSFNYFKPFPEEIDRVISSKFVDFHYCPNEEALKNISKLSGQKVNTHFNTLYDSLVTFKKGNYKHANTISYKYFVFVLHRQENLYDDDFVRKMVSLVIEKSKQLNCIFILHEPTEMKLKALSLEMEVKNSKNIKTYPRLPYFDFMNILFNAEFLVTDGGSNQEESYYLGLPCLVLRNVTERTEGLGHNVVMERFDFQKIESFFENYANHRRSVIETEKRPCQIIASHLEAQNGN